MELLPSTMSGKESKANAYNKIQSKIQMKRDSSVIMNKMSLNPVRGSDLCFRSSQK